MKNPGLTITLTLIIVLATVWVLSRTINDDDIHISISESEEELSLSASFPKEDSEKVHEYVKAKLKMSDLSDFRYVEIKHYQTPDHKMRFHIEARPGYIKIVLDRTENSEAAYRKLRATAEGVKKVLAE
jgi:hypothetical protein